MGPYLCLSPDPFVPLQVEEETARLASMPAWRRDMMKKKMDEERWVTKLCCSARLFIILYHNYYIVGQ